MSMDDDIFEEQSEKFYNQRLEKLAKMLDLTFEEVLMLDVSFDTEQSNEGMDVNTIVKFGSEADQDILAKIEKHMDGDDFLFVGLHALDPDSYMEDEDVKIADEYNCDTEITKSNTDGEETK